MAVGDGVTQLAWVGRTGSGGGGNRTLAAAPAPVAVAAQQQLQLPKGVVPYEFGVVNLAASLTDSQTYRLIPGSTAQPAQIGIYAPFDGSIVGLAFLSNASKTAGTCTWKAFVENVEKAALDWATGVTHDQEVWAPGVYPVLTGQLLDMRVTTDASFTPTTADIEVIVYLSQQV